ncbi:MAG: hypothetical protein ABL863_13805 [Nitrosomonas sp.]
MRWLLEADFGLIPKSTAISGHHRKPKKNMAPRPGLEPGTCGLTVRRSMLADPRE